MEVTTKEKEDDWAARVEAMQEQHLVELEATNQDE